LAAGVACGKVGDVRIERKHWVAGTLALLALLAPVKFGNPCLSHLQVSLPATGWEWVFFSWPNAILGLVTFAGVGWAGWRTGHRAGLVSVLALVFLLSQVVGVTGSICWQTSVETVLHFAVCVAVLLAAQQVAGEERLWMWVIGGLAVAVSVVVAVTLEQHLWGLEETRQMALRAYSAGGIPAGMLRKLEGGRVFGTLVNPNMLAGFLVVSCAPLLAWIWRIWRQPLVVVGVGALVLWCLWLTGSRGGWLAWAVMAAVWVLLVVRDGRWRLWALTGVGGMAIAAVIFLARGWSSMEARVDCWRAAAAIIGEHPWRGTGPGTFGSIYPMHKQLPVPEEAQLAHNSVLQVWSDTGVVAALVFAGLWVVGLVASVRRVRREPGNVLLAAMVAGLAGWLVHGLLDFGLHVPGVALPAFLFLGLVTGSDGGWGSTSRLRLLVVVAMVGLTVFWTGRILWANARASSGDWAGALRLAPRHAQYWSRLGREALRQGAAEAAVVAFSQAARWDPYRAVYRWELAQALLAGEGRPTERVVEALREAVRLYPGNAAYRTSLAEAEKILRQPAKKSGSVSPNDGGGHSSQGLDTAPPRPED
jgi:O-antigen ligase